jgi:putative radical SAM enzyme (TIGR03279 family)
MLDARIEIHAQVVLCPEINDGEILERTVRDLAALHPRIKSVAIVPLGLTRYNTDERLTPVTPEFCRRTISEIIPLQREFRKRLGTTFAFLGDEIYLRAGRSIPTRRHYGDYPQIEDGIGMVRSFDNDFQKLLRRLELHPPKNPARLHGTIMTGTLFAPVLKDMVNELNSRYGTRLHVLGVENRYFGGDVSVAGLLTTECYMAARSSVRGKFVIIPASSLKSGEAIMLDGKTLDDFERQIGLPVHTHDFKSFAQMISSNQ